MDVSGLKILDNVESSGMPLIVNRLSYGNVETDAVLNGTAKPIEAVLTSDGRSYLPVWHKADDGPETSSVYVERWTVAGMDFHGFVDAASRKIVQVG